MKRSKKNHVPQTQPEELLKFIAKGIARRLKNHIVQPYAKEILAAAFEKEDVLLKSFECEKIERVKGPSFEELKMFWDANHE